jgi:Tol biopolymer transport system component
MPNLSSRNARTLLATALLAASCGREPNGPVVHPSYPFSSFAYPMVNPKDSTIAYGHSALVKIKLDNGEYHYQFSDSGTAFWLMNWDGTNQRKVYPRYPSASEWSPDGRSLLIVGQEVAAAPWDGASLDFSTATPITSSFGSNPKWNPTMTKLIADNGRISIWTAATNQRGEYGENGWRDPAWSADGSEIIFWRYVDNGTELMVADTLGSNVRTLVHGMTYTSSPSWSPDGSRIAFVGRFGTGNPQLWTVRPDGTELTQLTTDGAAERTAWSPSGATIVYVHYSFAEVSCVNGKYTNGTIWRINPDTRVRQQLTFIPSQVCP